MALHQLSARSFFLLSILFLSGLLLSGCTSVPEGIKPVKEFELPRYLGKWYEIARYDHSFEEGLEQVTAEYFMNEDDSVKVINRGFDPVKKSWDEAEGKAYFVDKADEGHLKVSFFGPFYASYVVFLLDKENYNYAVITGPDRDYLWILARTPQLSTAITAQLLRDIKAAGFDTDKLIWVKHNI